ncbi:hypothetical protein F164LOC_21105 [Pectobacterium carotovorum]|nr:hypothetical protein F164LOC_21105 [Pectobacterium carotovorum]
MCWFSQFSWFNLLITLFYKENIFYFEPTLNQHTGSLNQHSDLSGYFLAGRVNQQKSPLNQRNKSYVGSHKPSAGAA